MTFQQCSECLEWQAEHKCTINLSNKLEFNYCRLLKILTDRCCTKLKMIQKTPSCSQTQISPWWDQKLLSYLIISHLISSQLILRVNSGRFSPPTYKTAQAVSSTRHMGVEYKVFPVWPWLWCSVLMSDSWTADVRQLRRLCQQVCSLHLLWVWLACSCEAAGFAGEAVCSSFLSDWLLTEVSSVSL